MTFGGKVAFDLQGSQVVVSRADDALHEDPAIESFLALLESDIRSGQRVCNLPGDVVQAMQATLERPVDLAANIDGDVALCSSVTGGACSFTNAFQSSFSDCTPPLSARGSKIRRVASPTPTSACSRHCRS